MIADAPSGPKTQDPETESFSGDFITHSAEETFELARQVGEHIKGGEVFLLTGDLGSGKTVFAKGLAAGLGIESADVTSPTFTLVNIHEGRLKFYHIDLYRLEPGEHQELGLEEIFENERAVTVIEWAERLSAVPENASTIEMFYVSVSDRRIIASTPTR